MNDEEVIRKLENVELPEIELKGHRQWLRTALLGVGLPKRQPMVAFITSVRVALRKAMGIIARGLFSRQPVWKIASVSALVLALALTLSLTLPFLSADSVYAQAVDIVMSSPEVRAALGDVETENVDVIEVRLNDSGGSVTLLVKGDAGFFTTEVDLGNGEVVYVSVLPELTKAERQAAINIAEADPGVRELLDKGAAIVRISPRYYDYMIEQEIIRVVVEKDEEIWFALIDLDEGCVLRFTKLQ
jgi:hypothetical protein